MIAATKSRLVLALTLVFLAGLATGVFGGAWHARHAFAGRHGERMGERMRERLQHELSLTPEQLQQMNPILDETTRQLQEIRAETGRRVSDTVTQSHERLAANLTPEQQTELRRMERRHHGFRRRHRDGEPPSRSERP